MLSGNSKIRFCWSGSIDRFHGNRRATPTTICMSQFYLSVYLSIYCIYLFTVYTVSIYCVNLSTLSIHQSTVSIYVLQRSIYLRYLTMSLSSYIYLLYPSHLSIFTAPNHHIDPSISLSHTHTHSHTRPQTPTHSTPKEMCLNPACPQHLFFHGLTRSPTSLSSPALITVQWVCGVPATPCSTQSLAKRHHDRLPRTLFPSNWAGRRETDLLLLRDYPALRKVALFLLSLS